MHYTDEEILSKLDQDNTFELGFKYMMVMYKERIYWLIRKIVISHEDADDVLQNTFVKVFRAIKNFENRSSLYTWLHRIAVNEALTFIKKSSSKGRAIPLDANLHSRSTLDDGWKEDEVLFKLKAAIDELPTKQKEVFLLRYYDEMTYQEMSDRLDTSVGSLKASYHHAVKKIEISISK
jgi:RNA polymerase sigma-70 factor (ECF subfamily)